MTCVMGALTLAKGRSRVMVSKLLESKGTFERLKKKELSSPGVEAGERPEPAELLNGENPPLGVAAGAEENLEPID